MAMPRGMPAGPDCARHHGKRHNPRGIPNRPFRITSVAFGTTRSPGAASLRRRRFGQMNDQRGKYAALLDAETWDYIEEVDRWFPPGLADEPLAEQRAVYNAMCRHFHSGRPADVVVENSEFRASGRGIWLRHYTCPTATDAVTMLYFHGGGFVFGDLDSHDDVCADICSAAGIRVVSVDYRLAPEHPHPSAYEDALAAFRWLEARGDHVVLAGESAGGSLAAAVAQTCREAQGLAGLVLIYPVLGAIEARGSGAEHGEAPLLAARDIRLYSELRSCGESPSDDPTFHPLDDRSLSGLPPTRVVTAQCDPLSDQGKRYAERIVAEGGDASFREEPRLTHSFLRSRKSAARARAAFDSLTADIVALKRMIFSSELVRR